ncbi:hypothetical protein G1H11_22335 [Phytoactinopolyspora alkaliphila]|uniref:DUF1795 domain-containing protein n=1 Tax=Phytoactinopolyspora alkaliphila TaxID=1783498 RepID=A0A6N9YSN1_9ACTN|nr:hypothetical protein [Phytoactinopolyspora alkaliphila]NED98041.1 hypothetical protein [Phytoactinopolyspora alkaliphila]
MTTDTETRGPTAAAETAGKASDGATTVRYPSYQLPSVPPFHIDVPEGYVAHPAPRALAVVRPASTAEDARFIPNVTVTADLVPAGADPKALLEAMVAAQASEVAAGAAAESDTPGSASQRLCRTVDGVDVIQVATVWVLPVRYAGDVAHALTVVSSWADGAGAQVGHTLRAIHESFRVESGQTAGA